LNDAAALFGESASRAVVSASSDNISEVLARAQAAKVPARIIGETGGNRLRISVAGRPALDVLVDDAERVWSTAIERVFARRVA
jgi:phosphoribosylformylglycinamidine synthase